MLSNFNFGTNWWGVGNEEGGTVNLSSLIRDEEEKDLEGNVQDLDELADRLLTQFPPYGTNHSLVGSQQDADWLLSEEDDDEEDIKNIPTQEELHNANRHPGLVPVSLPVAPAPSSNPKNCLPLPPSATMTDWDYDEQFLWKPEAGREEQKHNEHYYRRTGSTNTGSSFLGIEAINNTSYLSQTGKQQWMYGRNSTNFQQQQPGDTNNTNATATNVDSTSLVLSPTQKMKKEQQQKQQQSKNSNINPNEASNTHFQNSNSNNTARDFYNSRQHWMPDQLCKHCYACDTPFTVFRRRHHCRLCGQVFCSACSAYFVPAQKKGSSTLRTCQMCYDQVTQRGGILMDDDDDNEEKKEQTTPADNVGVVKTADTNGSNAGAAVVMTKLDEQYRPVSGPEAKTSAPASPKSAHSKDSSQRQQHQRNPSEASVAARIDAAPVSTAAPSSTSVWMERESSQEVHAHWQEALHSPSEEKANDIEDAVKEAKRHLGLTAANHLEKMGESLLDKDAPLLWKQMCDGKTSKQAVHIKRQWLHKLMTLATRCCATVEPNVKKGDLLDIRPYVKIKVIPGGSYHDSAYLSGIVFRKTVSHKRMAKEVINPKIMLLSGGIEFTRTENRIASLHTLLEQEGKYMEILVGRILKLKPDVLCVGRSVSRRALALLLKANVVLVQHVKATLMSRISRQTGATIISSTDHIMNQFGAHVLGKCNRFRLVTFRDNEVWCDALDNDSDINAPPSYSPDNPDQKSIRALLKDPSLSNHQRQAVLAANVLGDGVLDGTEAVKCGLAKRGVAKTFVMLEGCPKHLGCSVVLRGANRAALKQVKRVFRFLVNVSYNLRLETSYLKERCARIRPGFEVEPKHIFSSSLCVDYGSPPSGRKLVRPWNGGNNETAQRSISGEITAFDHQSILITSVWMTDRTQCCPAEVKGICYYSLQDVSLGQFLRDSCFNLSLKCQNPACKKSVDDHSLLFVHKDGVIKITVEHMDGPLPPPPTDATRKGDRENNESDDREGTDSPIATWTYCKNCNKVVTPLVYISENTWKFSFGKFLEVFFYNRDAIMNSAENNCSCPMQTGTMLYFGCGKLAARFSYERVRPLGVFVRKNLPIDTSFHKREALKELERISMSSSKLFIKFDKHIDKVAREARSLFGSAANRPEHLQTVLSELNRIGSEVDHAALTLQEKIASVSDKCRREGDGPVNEALLRFPWFSRRYLYMLTSAWNERLSAAGQAIVAMKKLASSAVQRGDIVIGPNGPAGTDELMEGMRRLRQLNEVYSRYNVTDITTVLPTIPGNDNEQDPDDEDMGFEDTVEGSIDFADGVDADVLASRRRLNNSKSTGPDSGSTTPYSNQHYRNQSSKGHLQKSLGTQRSFDSSQLQNDTSNSSQPRVTPGGAVKSAITRFFNRGGRDTDPYIVDLGMFKEGRPRLEPGVNGIVVPVQDEQLCTVIAYSLASTEYARQFKNFSKMEHLNTEIDENGRPMVDPSTGAHLPTSASQTAAGSKPGGPVDEKKNIEQRMLVRNKSHIKHTFRDHDEKGQVTCKFVCTTYWATQFSAVRQVFLSPNFGRKQDGSTSSESTDASFDVEQGYVQSLSAAYSWAASGGKSGASFARTADDRFVIKCISRTELQMFLDCAPAYFEYLSKAAFHGLPTVLCKIVGVYQLGYHNRETGKRSMEQVAVMQNIFYNRKISRVFDLKGSLRGRFAAQVQNCKEESLSRSGSPTPDASGNFSRHSSDGDLGSSRGGVVNKGTTGSDQDTDDNQSRSSSKGGVIGGTQLDGDFLEFTQGRPMPLNDRAKSLFHMSIQNDTLFLSIINVLDYSILVGIDEENMELVVGIIDFMRQYDILKQMERVGKSLPMVVGSEAPTIIQPPLYKARFTNAMERYFMTVPCKWTTI